MATIGHVAVGMAGARAHLGRSAWGAPLLRAMVLLSLLSLLPDADVIAFALGIPYHAPWGHRGAAHAPAFAALVGTLLGLALPFGGATRLRSAITATLVLGSHGLLDCFTDGGLGIALLWPLSHRRFFFPWQPLEVAPIGLGMLSWRGARILAAELAWFSPLVLFALWPPPRSPAKIPGQAPD